MLMAPANLKIYVARDSVDMRKSFDGLCVIVQQSLKHDPMGTSLFVFFNKARDKIKILYWDRNGHALWYKRLAKGRFRPPRVTAIAYKMSMSDLTCLLEGIDLLNKQRLTTI